MANTPKEENYSKIVDLIFDDAKRSIEAINDGIDNLNARLSAIVGFGVLLIGIAERLPGKLLEVLRSGSTEPLLCNSCMLLKLLALFSAVASVLIGVWALFPLESADNLLVSPSEQVEKCLELSEPEYKLLFIERYDRALEPLSTRRNRKREQLRFSGATLVLAAVLAALDLVLVTFLG